jgi:Lar family restriction alleviation protein
MKLKDCPFCGSKAKIIPYKINTHTGMAMFYFAECSRCGVETPNMLTKEDAGIVWNRRVEVKK